MELKEYNNFINHSITLDDNVLIKKMYNNNNDSYSEEKIKLLRTNITEYWCGLDVNNKIKYLKLINAKTKNIVHYDNFVKYGWNVDAYEFKEKFYNNDFDLKNIDNIKKIQMLRNDLTRFWKTLNEDEKIKFIELVNENNV
jgi:hypothetical protein